MSQQISIKDIARLSGVSIATVSRVLNHKGRYSKETEEKITKIIEEYGYYSNMAAKTLRESRSYTIGLIVPSIKNTFFSEVSLYIEEFFYNHGYSVLICNSSNSVEKEKKYFRSLASQKIDGILCISGQNDLTEDMMISNTPIICIDRLPQSAKPIPRVYNDDVAASYEATTHLIENGCKNILFISSYTAGYRKKGRLTGYLNALQDHHILQDNNYILQRQRANDTIAETEILVYEFLQSGKPVDGIVTTSEESALGAMVAVKRCNLSIPNDISIITFDNTILSRMASPTLTSVERAPYELAHTACQALLDLIDGKPVEDSYIIPTRIIARESTRRKK